MKSLILFVACILAAACTLVAPTPSKPVCDPASQPSPHYGVKDGKCLRSCGVLGGTSALETACDLNGKVDVGPSYDVPFCCRDKEPVCGDCSSHSPDLVACGELGLDNCGKKVCAPKGLKGCVLDTTPGDTLVGVPPPDVLADIRAVRDANPGMINDCVGHPIANNFLNTVVRKLQQKNKRWGYFHKPDGRIPRDILAYAYGPEREGTNKTYIIDFVCSGCGNTPGTPDFSAPQPNASVCWQLLNPSNGTVDNGVWKFNP